MVIAWPVPVMMGCIVLQALLVWYVLSRNPRGKINRAFALLTISLILWQISYSFQLQCMWTATGTCQLGFNDPIPFWERMRYFGLTFVGPATLYLVILSFVEFKIEKLQALQALLLALPVTVVFALVFSFLTQSNILYPHPELVNGTYQTGQGLLYHYNRMFSYTFLAAALLISFFRVFRPGYKLQRKQAFLFFVAIMVPLSASLDVSLGLGVYPLEFEFTPILFLVTAVLYGIGITQYKLFLMGPARETRSEEKGVFDLSMGQSFVVYEEEPAYAIEIFTDLVKHDIHGLAFIPGDIDHVRKAHFLPNTPIVRMVHGGKASQFSFSSEYDRDYVLYLARRFEENSHNSVILLGGMEQFIREDPDGALSFLKKMKRSVVTHKSRLLLVVPEDMKKAAINELLDKFVEL